MLSISTLSNAFSHVNRPKALTAARELVIREGRVERVEILVIQSDAVVRDGKGPYRGKLFIQEDGVALER